MLGEVGLFLLALAVAIVITAASSSNVRCCPHGTQWMLLVQVDTQNISLLNWAIEGGALEDADAMIIDHKTIRDNRDRFFFGMNELLFRHTDIVRTLTGNAPTLLPTLYDGLNW